MDIFSDFHRISASPIISHSWFSSSLLSSSSLPHRENDLTFHVPIVVTVVVIFSSVNSLISFRHLCLFIYRQ